MDGGGTGSSDNGMGSLDEGVELLLEGDKLFGVKCFEVEDEDEVIFSCDID